MTPRNNQNKRGDRRARQNKSSGLGKAVQALTISEMQEKQLSTRKDRATLRGKIVVNVSLATGGIGSLTITPQILGTRVSGLLQYFERYKIMKMVLKPILANPSVTSSYCVTDDPSITFSGSALSQIVEQRCSHVFTPGVGAESSDLQWNPIDPSTWFYTNFEGVVSDIRFQSPGSIYVISGAAAGTFSFIVYYSIEAEGAQNNLA